MVDRDERGALVRQPELVLVGVQPVPRSDRGDRVVVLVEDVVGALAVTRAGVALALPPGEDGLALVALDAEVEGLVAALWSLEPDRPSLVVDDLRALGAGRRGGALGATKT